MNREPDEPLQNHNPYRSPAWHEPVTTQYNPSAVLRWYRRLAVIQCLTIMVGVVAAFMHIESIIASGSVLTSVGLVLTVLSLKASWARATVFSVSGPAVSVLCFLLILINNWGPAAASNPVSGVAGIYSIIFLPLGLATIFSRPPAHTAESTNFSSH